MEIAAVIFVIIGLGAAYVVFRVLKKTVKFALRALIALVLIFFTLGGGLTLWSYISDAPAKKSSGNR